MNDEATVDAVRQTSNRQAQGVDDHQALRFTDGYDAMRQMLDPFKSEDIAMWLLDARYWPDNLSVSAAAARVRKCLDPKADDPKKQFFKYSELVFLQWRTGRHYMTFYECDVLGRQRPELRDTNREVQELVADVAMLEASLEGKKRRLQALMVDNRNGPMPDTDESGRRLRFSRSEGGS